VKAVAAQSRNLDWNVLLKLLPVEEYRLVPGSPTLCRMLKQRSSRVLERRRL